MNHPCPGLPYCQIPGSYALLSVLELVSHTRQTDRRTDGQSTVYAYALWGRWHNNPVYKLTTDALQ